MSNIWNQFHPLIIAEVGINHNGNLDTAIEMVHVAKESGADVVKFQTFKADEIVAGNTTYTYASNGKTITETQLEMFSRYELDTDSWKVIKAECDSVGITFMSTPQNSSDLDLLLRIGIPAIKVGSDDLVNIPLLKDYASRGLPVIISSGMAYLDEIDRALRALNWPNNQDVALLICTSRYPTPVEFANIRRVQSVSTAFPGLVVGFSDHTTGTLAAITACALGARIFEKHFTLDTNMEGPDHSFSPNPEDLTSWVKAIRETTKSLGTGVVAPDSEELKMREIAHRSIHAKYNLKQGDLITADSLIMRRPKTGLPPHMLDELVGRRVICDIDSGTPISLGMFK